MIAPKVVLSPWQLVAAAMFTGIAGIYYAWTWSTGLGDFGGDNAFYLLTARYFSPWSEHSVVVSYFVAHSHYPPLYPLLLGLFGGGESVLVAHIVTTTTLLLALFVLHRWLRTLDVSSPRAMLIVFFFAALPGTYLQALSILSENLYLLCSLFCLLAVAKVEREGPQRSRWLWVAAVAVVAATLTRSAGVALLIAFGVYLVLRCPPRRWGLGILATLPMVLWSVAGRHEGSGYLGAMREQFGDISLSSIWHYMASQVIALWQGWLGDMTISGIMIPAVALVVLVCLCGLAHRLWQRQFDAIYVAVYLLMVLIWPFPAEAGRLIYPVLAVLLAQGLLWLQTISARQRARWPVTRVAIGAYAFFIALAATPAIVMTAMRFVELLPPELSEYSRNRYWYTPNLGDARHSIEHIHAIAYGLQAATSLVPVDACVISIKPSMVGLYTDRIAKVPPAVSVSEPEFTRQLKDTGCQYAVYLAGTSPATPVSFYPRERLGRLSRDLLAVKSGAALVLVVAALEQIP